MRRFAALVAIVAVLAWSCGSDKASPTPVGSPVFISATNQVPISTLTLSTPAAGATPTAQRTPTTSPGVVTGPEVELTRAAQQASVAATAYAQSTPTVLQADVRAAAVSELKGADCSKPGGGLPSPNTPCVDFHMMVLRGQFGRGPSEVFYIPPSDLNNGLAVMKADFAGDERDYFALMGRDRAGFWKALTGFKSMTFLRVQLPGELLACPRNGSRANVFAMPGAANSRDGVAKEQRMKAEEFVLVNSWPSGRLGDAGYGFYRITSPVAGWVDSRDIADAVWQRCSFKESSEAATPVPGTPVR